jgi:hypothetical protein
VMLSDGYSRFDQSASHHATETYVCAKGFNGPYRARLQRVWGKVTAGKVTVDIYRNYHGKQVQHERQQIAIGDDPAVVLFNLDDGRRNEPLAEAQIANATKNQVALNRAILAQQLGSLSDPRFAPDRGRLPGVGFPIAARGAVGYQPQIISLPSGVTFSVTGVISADRRYVRCSPQMFVTGVGDVSTFTFSGASQPASQPGVGAPGQPAVPGQPAQPVQPVEPVEPVQQ